MPVVFTRDGNINEKLSTKDEDEFFEKIIPCPVCGKLAFPHMDSYEICENCGWTDDEYQSNNPDEDFATNEMSLNQAKLAYASGKRVY